MKKLYFFTIILLHASLSFCMQETPLNTRNLHISDQRRGANSVVKTVQDLDGYIWMASIQGIYVYDGNIIRQALTEYINEIPIRDIYIDSNNQLWVATHKGIFLYSLKNHTGKWLTNDYKENNNNEIHAQKIFEDPFGIIWIGTSNGLYRYEKTFNTFQRISAFPENAKICVKDMCVDAARQFWICTNHGLFLLDDDMQSAQRIPLATNDTMLPATDIATDHKGNTWVSIIQHGIQKICKEHDAYILRPIGTEQLPSHQYTALRVDSAGDLWMGTNQGLFRYSPELDTFTRHPLQDTDTLGDVPLHIASISEGKTGTLWVGTFNNGGFQCISNQGLQHIEFVTSAQNRLIKLLSCYCIYNPYDKCLWVAPKMGSIFRSEPITPEVLKNCKQIKVEKIIPSSRIYSIFIDSRKGIAFGTSNDTLFYITLNGAVEKYQLPTSRSTADDSNIHTIIESPDGTLLFADKHSIFAWKPTAQTPPAKLNLIKSPDFGAIIGIATDNKTLYIATTYGAFKTDLSLRPQTEEKIFCEQIYRQPVSSLSVDSEHKIWLSGPQGTFTLNPVNHTLVAQTLTTSAPILNAQTIWETTEGAIWANTLANIIYIPPNSSRGSVIAIGASSPADCIIGAPGIGPNGEFVFGHSKGALLLNPQALTTRSLARIVISDISIFDQPFVSPPDGRMPQKIELQYDQNYITFGFSALDFGAPKPTRYIYRLIGLDKEWCDSGTRNYASFGNLSPGDYTFAVKDPDSGLPPTTISIHIVPPAWLTPWAKTSYITLFLLLTFWTTRLYSRLQRNSIRQEMLETLVMQDALTGIPNRRKFEEVLQVEKSRCARTKNELSLIMIDVDYFKGYNDRYGHQHGDDVLRKVATVLKNALQRPEDFVARYGGEEFVAVLPNTARVGAEHVAESLQRAVHELAIPYPSSPISDRLTISLGVSSFAPETDHHIETGLFSADQALYQAKRSGRNCYIYREHILGLATP